MKLAAFIDHDKRISPKCFEAIAGVVQVGSIMLTASIYAHPVSIGRIFRGSTKYATKIAKVPGSQAAFSSMVHIAIFGCFGARIGEQGSSESCAMLCFSADI